MVKLQMTVLDGWLACLLMVILFVPLVRLIMMETVQIQAMCVCDLSAVMSTKSFENDYFSFCPNPVRDVFNIDLNKELALKQVNIYTIEGAGTFIQKKIKT